MHVPHATNFYGKFEIWIFFIKRLFQIKTALTFPYGLKKKYNISKTIYTKFYIWFQWPQDVYTSSPFSKFQREIWKHEDFRFCQEKIEKLIFFLGFFIFSYCFFYFLVILKFLYYFGIFKFFDFFKYFWIFWVLKIIIKIYIKIIWNSLMLIIN
jgi:hypothetical protein